MDYYQGVVIDYLRADRSSFVNDEYLIQLDEKAVTTKGTYWFCDALTVNFKTTTVFLCEITYSKTLDSLIKRLNAWNKNWPLICESIKRDSKIPENWSFSPWIFIPQKYQTIFDKKFSLIYLNESKMMPQPRVTYLEDVVPWEYRTWDRKD